MATNQINMYQLFQAVNQALQQNQTQLNQADTYNHDHGDNMVDVFSTIVSAIKQNSTATPAKQLKIAATQLRTQQSGSAQYYSNSLEQAARELGTAKGVNSSNAATLIETLLGGGQSSSQAGSAANEMIRTLLSGLSGASGSTTASGSGQSTIDWATLASAGLEYMQSKQEGKDTLTALMDALMAEPTKTAPYRKESGTVIANTLIKALGSILSKRR
jgi:alpha-D-ribose 1-methylphosphonate 5-triphosphate synthase subunit PhnG